ncbi:alpha/beta fold hydrolase [Flavobacterium selenitireducens]|uniref:alpha/beta fold hydrolase n=1 Tax=Flavobacterium selenitireducens TaxID=2722704 RepID=UPI00168B3B56|nr:alpha/beta fold hydrolase [Flavobacterium selenitireducens]MBD3580947.1 alpha/beta fold hydrolase [Flavobacterium selenitireducens]
MRLLLLSLFTSLMLSAQLPKDSVFHAKRAASQTKMVPVCGGKYKVFTQKWGNGKIKLLLLHGGPGHGHEYFENFPEALNSANVTVYFYDQLGAYFSDQPDDAAIWNVDRFVTEVEEVRVGLGLTDFYLLGHSWGGLLAQKYAAKYPGQLKGVILSNVPGFSTQDPTYFYKLMDSLDGVAFNRASRRAEFAEKQIGIDSLKNRQKIADAALAKRFGKVHDSIFGRMMYYTKAGKFPEPLARSMRHIENSAIEKYEFDFLKQDYLSALRQIEKPVLLLGSRNDFLHDERYFQLKKTMKAKTAVYLCPEGAHFPMWDDPETYFAAVRKFLIQVDSNRFNPDDF